MTNSIDDILANLFAAIDDADYGTEGNGQGYDVKVYGVPELKELLENLGLIAPESSIYTLADVHAAVAGFYYNASSNFATLQADILATIEALIVENSPVIDGGDTAAFSIDENTTDVATIAASDAQGDMLGYTLSGADEFLFNIDYDGNLSFKNAPDFEAPGDVGGDNVYDVTVTVSDGAQTDSQDIAVTVADVVESTPGLTLEFGPFYSGTVSGSEGDDTISFGNRAGGPFGNNLLTVVGDAGNDTISFGDSNGLVSVDGGTGNDIISFGDFAGIYGQMTIDGGAGSDTISFGDFAGVSGRMFSVDGGAGSDTISFGYWSGLGNNTVDGGAGNDTITFGDRAGAQGALTVDGGAGDDTISFGSYAADYGGNLTVDGGDGSDTISFGDVDSGPGNRRTYNGQITVDLGFADGAADELIFLGNVRNTTIQNWTAGEDAFVDVITPLEWTGVDNGTDTVFTAAGIAGTGPQSLTFAGVTGLDADVDVFLV